MNKYIFALILTLLGWTQIQAQNTDLRSAPDVPKFQATLNYSVQNGRATVTATPAPTVPHTLSLSASALMRSPQWQEERIRVCSSNPS